MSSNAYNSIGLGSRRNSRLGPDEARSRRSSMLRPGEDDMEEDEMIDPELRLRTVRTAGESSGQAGTHLRLDQQIDALLGAVVVAVPAAGRRC